MGQPLVSMLCHRGPVTSVAVDNQVRIREIRFVSPGNSRMFESNSDLSVTSRRLCWMASCALC